MASSVLVASVWLASCGQARPTAEVETPPPTSTTVPTTRSSVAPETTASKTSSVVSRRAVPRPGHATGWPALVRRAMAVVEKKVPAGLVLEAPKELPAAPGVVNAAQVRVSPKGFTVSLFHCPTALGVDSPGIGTGTCGGMENLDGSFGAEEAPSDAAARSLLRRADHPERACSARDQVLLQPGLWATVDVDPSTGMSCQASWRQDTWTFVIVGTIGSPSSGGWLALAKAAAATLDVHPLPPDAGVVSVDLAPDGAHSDARWTVGRTVEDASEYHGLLADLTLVRAMDRWPV